MISFDCFLHSPGPVATKFMENIQGDTPPIFVGATIKKFTALERPGSAEEMARTLAFIVSSDNVNMTGSIIVSDSGAIIKKAG